MRCAASLLETAHRGHSFPRSPRICQATAENVRPPQVSRADRTDMPSKKSTKICRSDPPGTAARTASANDTALHPAAMNHTHPDHPAQKTPPATGPPAARHTKSPARQADRPAGQYAPTPEPDRAAVRSPRERAPGGGSAREEVTEPLGRRAGPADDVRPRPRDEAHQGRPTFGPRSHPDRQLTEPSGRPSPRPADRSACDPTRPDRRLTPTDGPRPDRPSGSRAGEPPEESARPEKKLPSAQDRRAGRTDGPCTSTASTATRRGASRPADHRAVEPPERQATQTGSPPNRQPTGPAAAQDSDPRATRCATQQVPEPPSHPGRRARAGRRPGESCRPRPRRVTRGPGRRS